MENNYDSALSSADNIDGRKDAAELVRPILQALARMIVTDRRAVVLASHRGEILLANTLSQRLEITQARLIAELDWQDLCNRARRAGSETLIWSKDDYSFEGEIVHVPLGPAEGFLIRLAQEKQEVLLLRNRARAATLMRVAHDLRTPIQSLIAASHSLLAQNPAQQDDATRNIRRAAELALDHISDVLSVIGGEQAKRGGQPDEDFRIADEIRNLTTLVKPIAEARATEVHLNILAPQDLTLHGPLRFVRALAQNLIDNSVNHGGGCVKLSLEASPLNLAPVDESTFGDLWGITLKLQDEGGGLPAAQLARLQAALGLRRETASLGGTAERPSAGMNVLAHALKQLGGEIQIFDRGPDGEALPIGHGSRVIGTVFIVRFSLPRAPSLALKAAPSSQETCIQPLLGKHILLIEDSPASRDWLAHILESGGAQVSVAGSGPEAFAMLSRNEFATSVDLVLTDVTLPRMSGIEVAAHLQKGDPASAVVWKGMVVGLTAHADERIRAACLKAGMLLVLEKPIQPNVLIRALAECFANGALQSEATKVVMPEDILAQEVVQDLVAQLGAEKTQTFMKRALAEAQSVVQELREDGIGDETGRRLHAATGACGLTGLAGVERSLRALEMAVDDNDLDQIPEKLAFAADVFSRSLTEIDKLYH